MSIICDPEKTKEALEQMGYIEEKKQYEKMLQSSSQSIPLFYISSQNSIIQTITKWAIENTSRHLDEYYLKKEHVDKLKEEFTKMTAASSLSGKTMSKAMTYSQYCQLRQILPDQLSILLSAKLFLEIGGPSLHTINSEELFKYLYMIPACVSHYSKILLLDPSRTGYLNEESVLSYVQQCLPNFPYVEEAMDQRNDYESLFLSYVVQRFLVVLDPMNIGRISIEELLNSEIYQNFVLYGITEMQTNQFRQTLVDKVIDDFDDIDEDQDGNITAEDLTHLAGCKFTRTFTNRVVEVLGQEKNDFSWFIRFKFAWDNIGSKWANAFFFDVMDVDGNDKITQFEVNYFYREIVNVVTLKNPNAVLPLAESLLDEKLDMVGATNGEITRKIFINSRYTENVVKQLVDIKAYSEWERISL